MVFKKYLKYLYLGLFIFCNLNSATINLFNHSKYPVCFRIDVKHWFDTEVVVLPLESYSRSGIGDINKVTAFPFVHPFCKDEISSENLKKEVLTCLKDKTFRNLEISITLGEGDDEYNVSFDLDENDTPILKKGCYGLEKAINFLVISDVHTIAKTEQELLTMDLSLYGGNARREKVLNKHRNKIALRDKMISYIQDTSQNIRAVIMPGDSAGGYGKKSETEAFKYVWYNPLRSALFGVGGRPFLGIGNHDTYWSSCFEPKPPKMLRFVKSTYGDYNYSYNIGSMHFINLSLCPSVIDINGVDPSLIFLINDLKYNVNRTRPIVIFFHYPIHGHMSDWWSLMEKNIFYNLIKDYNVVLIACGHSHKSAKYEFRDKKIPVILAAGSEFALVKWNPTNPNVVRIRFIDAQGNVVAGSQRLRFAEEGDKLANDVEIRLMEVEKTQDLNKTSSIINSALDEEGQA